MATKKPTTSPDGEPPVKKQKTKELGGVEWEIFTPIPGILMLKLGEAVDANKGQNGVFLDIMYAAVGPGQREDFDARMMAPPVIDSEDITEFISWLIEESTATPLEEF